GRFTGFDASLRQRRVIDKHLSAIGRDRSGQDLNQCRFSSAVFSAKRVNLAARDVHADAAQRVDASVGLADVADIDERRQIDRSGRLTNLRRAWYVKGMAWKRIAISLLGFSLCCCKPEI